MEFWGPLRVQRLFYPEKECAARAQPCHCYILHPPGGLVSGDSLTERISAAPGAAVLLTTPEAARVYSRDRDAALQRQRVYLKLEDADLEWLPQESIVFDKCRAELSLEAELDERSSFCCREILCLGRSACQERFDGGRLWQRLMIKRAGVPLVTEVLRLDPGSGLAEGNFALAGCSVTAALYAVAPPERELQLQQACSGLAAQLPDFFGRERLFPEGLAAVTFRNHVAIVRYLGSSSIRAGELMLKAWQALRPAFAGRRAVKPRIWDT